MTSKELSLNRSGVLARPALDRAAPWIALASGGVNVFAFAPFGLWPLQILTLAVLFGLVAREMQAGSARRSFLLGWTYGFGWFACGVWWLYVSMHRYGGLPSWMAILAVALLATVLGMFTGSASYGATWLTRRVRIAPVWAMLAVAPACWLLGEWLRGWILTGFPWVASGYAHTASPLAGFAPIVGVYGIGGLAAVIAGAFALLPKHRMPLIAAAALLAAGAGLHSLTWTAPHGEPISVRLLQGNVPQEMKFEMATVNATLALYRDMIHAEPADLIATPETALPLLAHRLPAGYLDDLMGFSRQTGSHLALGVPISDAPRSYANSVLGFGPQQAAPYRYDKHHLVPFGEFIPPGARWFVNMMNIPLGDFTRGTVRQPAFAVKGQWVMPNICYEDLFGEEIADQLGAAWFSGGPQPTMLLNVSNIAWFGDTIALPQHLQISQMRSLETGRPMLRATNTGVTAVIDHRGRVAAQLRPYTRGALAAKVQGYAGWTPYILFGNLIVVLPALLLLGGLWFFRRKAQSGLPVAD